MELPTGYRIRNATNNDGAEIRTLVFGVLMEYGLSPDPVETDKDLYDLSESYNDNCGCFDVMLNEGDKIIATSGVFKINKTTCELRKMYLLKEQRGKGLGKILLEYSIERAKSLGYTKMILETASVLKEAINLYKSFGFREMKEEHLSARCDQRFYLDL